MNIQELEHRHFIIPDEAYMAYDKHTKLSIQFTIEILERGEEYHTLEGFIKNEIEELKKYL